MRFYPRIIGISLVPLDGEDRVLEIGVREADLRELIRAAADRSTGAPVLVRYPSDLPAYLIVKRSPNSEAARYGLALVIDAAALLDGDSDYWTRAEATRWLALPDGTPLVGAAGNVQTPQFTRALSSGTQPLELKTAIRMTMSDILPPGRVVLVLAVIALGALALRVIGRQRAEVRAAEARAELSGLETRLSHASRVNALGEMASGMAHELTQPLTAILAQAQAARHLAARGDTTGSQRFSRRSSDRRGAQEPSWSACGHGRGRGNATRSRSISGTASAWRKPCSRGRPGSSMPASP